MSGRQAPLVQGSTLEPVAQFPWVTWRRACVLAQYSSTARELRPRPAEEGRTVVPRVQVTLCPVRPELL